MRRVRQSDTRVVDIALSDWPSVTGYSAAVVRTLAKLELDAPEPVVVVTGVSTRSAVSKVEDTLISVPIGDGTIAGTQYGVAGACAGFRVTYGAGAALKTAVFDLMNGNFQLPPVTVAHVEMVLWLCAGEAAAVQASVSAAAVVGSTNAPSRPRRSAMFALAASATESLFLAGNARWLDISDDGSQNAIGAAAAPVLRAKASGFGFPQVVRDYVNKSWFPSGQPVEVQARDVTTFDVVNTGTGAAVVTVNQYLEL